MKSSVAFGLVLLLLIAATIGFFLERRTAASLRAENVSLRQQLQSLQDAQASANNAASAARDEGLGQLKAQVQDIARLRSEVTQLRASAAETDKLRGENQLLRTENQQLRAAASGAASGPAAPAATQTAGHFPREAWSFAGYGTPENALVSAIWAMREGNPKTYFESLSADEQARMAKVWENKSETEVAVKHQGDVSKITGLRVLERQEVSPEQITMSVYIGGVDRLEKVSMRRVGEEWKFGGFIREAK